MTRRLLVALVLSAAALAPRAAHADATRQQCVDAYEKAQLQRKANKLTSARESLLVCAQDGCPSATRTDCVPWLAEVEKALPTIAVAVRDEGRDVADATITIDGAPSPEAGAGRAVTLDPGTHQVRAQVADGRTVELEVVARPGEKNRPVTLTLPPVAGASRAPTQEPPAEAASRRSIALPLALTVVGAAGVTAALVFGFSAKSQADDLRGSCGPRCSSSDLDDVKAKLLYSDIGLGVGIVALAAAAYFWIKPAARTSAQVTPVVSASRAGVAVRF
jgi:hypothetical protein